MNNFIFEQTEGGHWRAEFESAGPLVIQLETAEPSSVMVGAHYPEMPNAGLREVPGGAPFVVDVPAGFIVTLTVDSAVVKQVIREFDA